MVNRLGLALLFVHAASGCNVSTPETSTGGLGPDAGVPSNASGATGTSDGGSDSDALATAACPRALVVVSNDFTSSNVSVLSPEGSILSESIVSSSSATSGLTMPLSGDVVLPQTPTPGAITLLDRYPNAVLDWLDPTTAAVRQLSVATGFAANPHDYLALSDSRAYVTRYETNANAGRAQNDGGGDVLIVDPSAGTITGRIAFTADPGYLPRPDRMLRVGDDVWVTLQRYDANFTAAEDGQVVGIGVAGDSIAWTLELPGVANCGGFAPSPAGGVVALSCTGVYGEANALGRSGIVLLDATVRPPVELGRFPIAAQLGAQLGSALAYASPERLVGVALGDGQAGRNDIAYALDLATGTATVIADAGAAYAFGDILCMPGCGDRCYLADAHAKGLRAWHVQGGGLEALPLVPVDPSVGLPPRSLGRL